MKKFICIFLVIVSVALKAQTFSVGDTSCNYVVLNKSIYVGYGSTNYSIDIDGDLINDISLDWVKISFGAGSGAHTDCTLTCSSATNYDFVYSPVTCYLSTSNVASNLAKYSPLKSNLSWVLNPSNSYVYEYCSGIPMTSPCYHSCGSIYLNGETRAYLGFRKVLVNDTIYGWLLLRTNSNTNFRPDIVESFAYKHTASNSTITPVFTNTLASVICGGSTFSLSAIPSGGNFYGIGVTGNIFNSAVTGGGMHSVYYTQGCGLPAVLSVSVTVPAIVFTNSLTSVCNGDSLVLTASPSGGSFGGLGVTGSVFQSSVTGVGTKTVSYFYTDGNGCTNTKTLGINVVTSPILTITPTASVSCPGTSITLIANGASSYTWSTGATTPSIVVNPTVGIVYTVTGVFASGTCPSGSITYSQSVKVPTVSASINPSGNSCPGWLINVYANGASSYLWSTSATTSSITANPTVTTIYSVIGTNYGGCSDTAFITQIVNPNTTVTAVPNKSVICVGDTAFISLTGGVSYGVQSATSYTNIPTGGTIVVALTPTTTTNYTVYSSCASPVSFTQNVSNGSSISLTVNPAPGLLCPGQSLTLTATGASTYSWSTGSSSSAIVVNPTATTLYSLTGVDAYGCKKRFLIYSMLEIQL